MEITSVTAFLDYFERVRERTLRLINVIPEEAMDRSYKPGKFTIADMIRHIAATERYMYAENVAGRQSSYHGCGKDLADGRDAVMAYMNEMHRQSVEIFRTLDNDALQSKCPTPGGEMTTWKWLRAMVEHEVHHRGELYIYLNLLDIATPPIFGLTEEEVQQRSVRN
jgi:uncharacterized damage-inducible protein DinB